MPGDIRSSVVKSGRAEIGHSVVERGVPRHSNYIHNECRERFCKGSVSVSLTSCRRAADLTRRPRLQSLRPQTNGRPHSIKDGRSVSNHEAMENDKDRSQRRPRMRAEVEEAAKPEAARLERQASRRLHRSPRQHYR